jgi:hypothetical protein
VVSRLGFNEGFSELPQSDVFEGFLLVPGDAGFVFLTRRSLMRLLQEVLRFGVTFGATRWLLIGKHRVTFSPRWLFYK